MTDNNHPITPSPDLVDHWFDGDEYDLATKAARWGADQELEACVEWMIANDNPRWACALQEGRRPKPPSLKELNLKHLEVMERDGHYLPEIISDLRRAIESLPN